MYGIIVSQMAFNLEFDKLGGKVLEIIRKIFHSCLSVLFLGMSMVDRTIGLPPGRQTPVDCGLAHEAISTIPTDGMEHCIVSCAHSPLEIRLPWFPCTIPSYQSFGSDDEITRLQCILR